MLRSRFARVWLLWSALYVVLAVMGPNGLLRNPVWPDVSQHLMQARAWLGIDIEVPVEGADEPRVIPVVPRLDVTPYFQSRPVRDPRENGLVSNLAVGVVGVDGEFEPVQDHWEKPGGRPAAESLVCHVGFPPGPALLLLPFVLLLRGMVATQWLSAILGGLGVAAVDRLAPRWVEEVLGDNGSPDRAQVMVLAGAGTLFLWIVPDGGTFLFAQTVGCVFSALALLAAWHGRWWWSGLAFGLAVTSRPAVIGVFVVLLAIILIREKIGSLRVRNMLALCCGPSMLGGLALLLNHLRFQSVWDFGYRFMIVPPFLRERLLEHGQLSWHHLGRNVQAVVLQLPALVRDDSGTIVFPFVASDPVGMGFLFVTPAFLVLVLACGARDGRGRTLLGACWAGLVLACLPGLLYYNTGWVQWGGRFLLDAWPLWLLLAAVGSARATSRFVWVVVVISVVSNAWAVVLTMSGLWPGCCS